jgi:hypothetical protein
MNRLCIATRGICSWRGRLASPETQWRQGYSALETAVSWEGASAYESGLPESIIELFRGTCYTDPVLMFAIAEHKVPLAGLGRDSQSDVWALLNTNAGFVSMSVEGKAKEAFGEGNEPLTTWLVSKTTEEFRNKRKEASRINRKIRWGFIQKHLPSISESGYSQVAYQLLHRCASAVIEARRLRLNHAVFVVQAFKSPQKSFEEYSKLCRAMSLNPVRGQMQITAVNGVRLGIGWVDCPLATDTQIAALA